MQDKKLSVTNNGHTAQKAKPQNISTGAPKPECDAKEHPAPGDGCNLDRLSDEEAPRLVIRGESILTPPTTTPQSALIDWLNFTFPFRNDPLSFIELDKQLGAAFGFAVSCSRNKGYLGYSDSWDLGLDYGMSYGILATGGQNSGQYLSA